MDFLNKAWAQLQELFGSMSNAARITTAAMIAVVVVSIVWLFSVRVGGPESDLMHGMPVPASHIPAMEAAFAKANLHNYEVRGTSIRVPRGQEATYMAALADAKALPPNFSRIIDEPVNDSNPFESKQQREDRKKASLQKLLSLIISQMQGVESAVVVYDTEVRSALNREKVATASVGVKPAGSGQIDEATVSKIRHLVASSIAGMKAENVTVADTSLSGRVYHGKSLDVGNADESLYLAAKRTYEQELRTKILNSLWVRDATVEATVVLDRTRMTRARHVKFDPKTVPYRETETSDSHSREGGGGSGGRPGIASQAANAAARLTTGGGGGMREEEERSKRETHNMVPTEHTEKETLGLTPTRAQVSVGVPNSYFEKVWRESNPNATGAPEKSALDTIRQEESTKIQRHVAALLPPSEGVTDPLSLITVTPFQDLKPPEIPAPPVTNVIVGWLYNYWPTLGVMGLAVFSLLMLRSMLRAAPTAPLAAAPTTTARLSTPATATPLATTPELAESSGAARLRRLQAGKSIRDELSEMVQENPDTAANILKTWIGNVG